MQHLEVSGAVRHIYIYIYVIKRLKVNIIIPSTFTRTSPKMTPLFRFSTKILCSFLASPCPQFALNKVKYMTN